MGVSYAPTAFGGSEGAHDVILVVHGEKLPADGKALALRSLFFREALKDARRGKGAKGKVEIQLEESVSVEDAMLMLAMLSSGKGDTLTADEARRVLDLGDKYGIPSFFKMSKETMAQWASHMYFIKTKDHAGLPAQQVELLDAGRWLGIADRLGLKALRAHCLAVVLRDLGVHVAQCGRGPAGPELGEALSSLQRHGVSSGSVCEIAAGLVHTTGREEAAVEGVARCEDTGALRV